MRPATLGRWAMCALVLSIGTTALAEKKKSLADCTSFEQTEKNDDTVTLSVKNSCTIPLDCSMSWRVVCAPDSKKRRSVHPNEVKSTLDPTTELQRDATAAICGDDTWTLDSVTWTCAPNKD